MMLTRLLIFRLVRWKLGTCQQILNAKTSLFICSMFRLCGLCPHFSVSRVSDIFCENIQETFPLRCPLVPVQKSANWIGFAIKPRRICFRDFNPICHKTPEDLFLRIHSDLPGGSPGSPFLVALGQTPLATPRGPKSKVAQRVTSQSKHQSQ